MSTAATGQRSDSVTRGHTLLRDSRTALLDDEAVELQLLRRALEHLLLDGILSDEAEDVNLLLLSDAMRSVHSLQIGLRVPVAVVKNDDVCRIESDAETTSSGGEQEDVLG